MNTSAFDNFAKPFFDMAGECAELMGATSFITDTEPARDKKGEIVGTDAYLIRFRFDCFFMEFVYSPRVSARMGAPSTLSARIYPDPRERGLPFSPYELADAIATDDFTCRQFSWIESEKRLTDCCRFLAQSFVRLIPRIEALARDDAALEAAYARLREEINGIYRNDIFSPSGNGDTFDYEMLQLRLYAIERWKSSFYASEEYSAFLNGDPSRLLSIASPRLNRPLPVYIRRLAAALGQAERACPPLAEEVASLPAMIKCRKRASTFPVVLLACLFSLPVFAALFAGLYALIAVLTKGDALLYTAQTIHAFFSELVVPLVITVPFFAPLFVRPVLWLFFRKRYEANKPYWAMIKELPGRRPGTGLRRLLFTVALLLTVLSACRGVLFREDSFTVRTDFFPFSSETISYREVSYLLKDGEAYRVVLKDGRVLDLSAVMRGRDAEQIRKTLKPVFDAYGIEERSHPPIVQDGESTAGGETSQVL